jgi:hypothetical protein
MKQMGMFDFEARDFLEEIRKSLKEKIEGDGGVCPCCDRKAKVYPFKITQALAQSLRWIYLRGEFDGWVNVQEKGPQWILRAKNYGMLAHWNLIESSGSKSGVWRITKKGIDFLNGSIAIPSKLYIYNNEIYGLGDELISFRNCFGRHFDFDEMMSDLYMNEIRTKRGKKT